ncbi:hypothetical protein F991_00802 [Acinetobacter sp. CIP-A165]|uniref:hypothetical protein n=1 Tax=Acinetobacter sp. CIP-A165 TaxID=40373 RepID=UPI0002D00589|nr:hypothetical protein [Acinetobacter sp. CIP-A165]ENU31333.1 hypothetical protein F991_00802 [Acinetobacter sp. CIP-A165]
MLFNYTMNERILAFSRNIAALLLIGGFGLFVIDRAMTKPDLLTYEYLMLLWSGIIMFCWSLYLASSNIAILYYDYRNDLLKCLKEQEIEHDLTEQELKSTTKIINVLGQKSWRKAFHYYCRSFTLGLICFVFILLYFIGVIAVLNQQSKLFGFLPTETKCNQVMDKKSS